MSSCGCTPGNGSTPPSGFSSTSSAPAGASNSYGGSATIAGGVCPPALCLQPLTTSQVTRSPYCPDWVDKLFGSYAGKLIIKVGACLHYLRSPSSGWVRYNGSTESVTVDNAPPFVSSAPRGAKFGYLAKTIPTQTQLYDEATGTCSTVITQELASQVLETRADGQLLLGNYPLPGEIPVNESGDAANQTRLDYLGQAVAEDELEVSPDIGILVDKPYIRTVGGMQVVSKFWMRMKSLIFRKSQWGQVLKINYGQALQVVAYPVSGGTADDPAFRLMLSETGPSDQSATFPANHLQGDTVVWNGAAGSNNPNLPENSWASYPKGLGFFPFASPRDIVINRTTVGTVPVTLPDFPSELPAGVKGIMFYTKSSSANNTTNFNATYNSRKIGFAFNGVNYMETTVYFNPNPDTKTIDIVFTKVGTGAVTCDIAVVGYFL